MKVFSKEKFIEKEGMAVYAFSCGHSDWVNKCNGKQVEEHGGELFCIVNKHEAYYIHDWWCIEVPDAVEETAKKEREDLWATLNACDWKSAFEQAANCRCVVPLRLTDNPPKHPHYVIAIECTGDITFAKMFVDDKLVKVTSAKRNPEDKFSWRIGAQTAFNRLWEKKKKPVKPVDKYVQLFNEKLTEFATAAAERIFRRFDKLPPAVREVKRDAKPGEWVKVVAANGDPSDEYKNGDVLQILGGGEWSSLNCHGEAYYKEAAGKFLQKDEYVVLEGYRPE